MGDAKTHNVPQKWAPFYIACNGDVTTACLNDIPYTLTGMRFPGLILAGLLCCSALASAQESECASVSRNGGEVVMTADFWDPVYAISATLADHYGISVSVESPQWSFPSDAEDVALADPQFSALHHDAHYLAMKPHTVQIRFAVVGDAVPADIHELLLQLANSANKALPYGYRLDAQNGDYVLVPTKTRNSAGQLEDVQPLLDRHVSISPDSRPIAEHAKLMADDLSSQTGLHISCCQSMIAGVPWGRTVVPFEAKDEPARDVLRRLIRLEEKENAQDAASRHASWHSPYDHWTVRCDGTGVPWCFIEVRGRFNGECRERVKLSPEGLSSRQ